MISGRTPSLTGETHGPTVLVEYGITRLDPNHMHTVWRDLENDFGGDVLRRHYSDHARPHRPEATIA